jgi:nitrite reductase/ring-hydroxylating ferredoxin subunit
MPGITRREALGELAIAAGAIACAAGGCTSQPSSESSSHGHVTGPVDVGTIAELPTTLSDGWSRSNGFLLVRQGDQVYALSSECTHKHCTVRASNGAIRCPCHGAAFDLAGNVTKGPADEPLPRVWIERNDAGRIIVDASRAVEPDAIARPGGFIDLSATSRKSPSA